MEYAYNLYGVATPLVRKYQIGDAMSDAGVPVLVGGAGEEGVVLPTTTAAADLVGITLDTQSRVTTAQQSDNSDTETLVSVIIQPGAVYRTKISGGATEDTALTQYDVTTASTDGLSVTTGDAWNSPDYDEGLVFGYDGANAGLGRKITSTSASAATVTVAFPFDTAVGDNFLRFPFVASPYGMEDQFVQLTSSFYQVDASVTVDTDNDNFRVVELDLRDHTDSGTTNCFAYLIPFDSVFAAGGSV